jgi:hypothetical protein
MIIYLGIIIYEMILAKIPLKPPSVRTSITKLITHGITAHKLWRCGYNVCY